MTRGNQVSVHCYFGAERYRIVPRVDGVRSLVLCGEGLHGVIQRAGSESAINST